MNVVLWVLQALLAAVFGMAGLMKSSQPREKLAKSLPWVEDLSLGTVRLIGVVELLAALGLILPAATGIAVVLTPLAATGLAVVMILAAIVHARRKEAGSIPVNVVLLALAVVVAWGRFGPYSF
ncbi:DoxX family protein [Streptomyces muensis]|uniref:DoxX family protein n=1 Tax=Streptomyces muensis TaxID=1077944 RepID=A0A9X1TLM1_STRM4|nr:DoxX family protein [Streptomyces muensis]MCF1595210.1 DoxX family protein [Streptomyces muensis]